MLDALSKECVATPLGPVDLPLARFRRYTTRMTGRSYYPERTMAAARFYAQAFEHKLAQQKYDIIFAPAASVEISRIKSNIPIVYCSDTTFKLIREGYSIFNRLSPAATSREEYFEQTAINKASLCLYPSEWAARSAQDHYDAPRVKVVPFGANLTTPPAAVKRNAAISTINLLFLAKEWERKGGPVAVDTLLELRRMKIDALLTIVGVTPPGEYHHPGIKIIPYLDKNVPAEREKLQQILLDAHALLLPTRHECYGIVFCEAAAYGLPVFSTNVGGIKSVVIDGQNGYLLAGDATGKDFAEKIATVLPERHEQLSRNARRRYEEVLNWGSWADSVVPLLQELVK